MPTPPALVAAAATAASADGPIDVATTSPGTTTSASAATVTPPLVARSAARLAATGALNAKTANLLDAVANWLTTLPNQKISDLLGGALLLARRDLFNQAPTASPVQEVTISTGQIQGTVGAVDPESDPLAYSVLTDPQFGTVTVSADGHYSYTPGQNYTGTDSFTVKIADTSRGVNLLNIRGDRATEVTVNVGAQASTDPFCANNLNDASLLLKNTAAEITVNRKAGKLAGSVTLNIPDNTPLLWLDEQGRTGQISAADVANHWDGIQNAGHVMLGIDYTLADGTDATLILKSVQATTTGSGQYTFTGTLAPDIHDTTGVNSFWDVVGNEFKASYENFLSTNNIHANGFRSLTQSIDGASLYLDTFNVHDYQAELVGTDPGVPVSGSGTAPGGAATRVRQLSASATTATPGVTVTAMLPYGSSLVVGQSDGSVELWDGQSFNQLHLPGPWGGPYTTQPAASPVKAIIPYQTGFVLGLGNGAVEQWDGTQWKELHSYSSVPDAQVLTTMFPYANGFITATSQGDVSLWTGTDWKKLAGYNTDAAWGSAISTVASYKTGIAVGLAAGGVNNAGAVEFWNGTNWQELQGATGTGVTSITTDNGDLVVGRSNGMVEKWDGTTWAQLSGAGSPVTAMLVDPLGSLVVGRADGSVQRDQVDTSCYSNCSKSLTRVLGQGNTLTAGQKLNIGDSLTSANGAYSLTLQQDGNRVLSQSGQAVWATNTWGNGVTSADLQADGNFVLYAGSSPMWSSNTNGKTDVRLVVQDDRNVAIYSGNQVVWQSATQTADAAPAASGAVTSLLAYGDSFIASFADGSVKQGGVDWGSGQPVFRWIDMAPKGTAGVTAMAPYSVPPSTAGQDGFYLGLDNGVIKRYAKWSNKWYEMRALPEAGSFSQDTLKQAVQFAQGNGQATSAGDPLFGTMSAFQPLCMSDNSCGTGSIYSFNLSKAPASLASKNLPFAGAGQSVDLSYDLGVTGYGYVYVPGGVWKKLDPDQYSFGALLAVTTGPSLNLNLGNGCANNTCTLNVAQTSLASYSWSTPPSPYGNVTLTGDVSAKLDVELVLPDGFSKNKLTASAYVTGGVAVAYNTPTSYWNSGWNYYIDKNVDDFTNLTSVSIIPTITPSITGAWGYTVTNVPVLGTVSLASIGLTYSNPVDLNLTQAQGSPLSLTVGSSGNLDFSAGFVPDLTDALTYTTTFPLYSVRTGNLLSA